MIATAFDEETSVLGPPKGMTEDEVFSLSVAQTHTKDGGVPVTISCWKPTTEEWEEMKRTGRVWLVIMGQSMPPVMVVGNNPFKSGLVYEN